MKICKTEGEDPHKAAILDCIQGSKFLCAVLCVCVVVVFVVVVDGGGGGCGGGGEIGIEVGGGGFQRGVVCVSLCLVGLTPKIFFNTYA